jgi:hypothetical protein
LPAKGWKKACALALMKTPNHRKEWEIEFAISATVIDTEREGFHASSFFNSGWQLCIMTVYN